MTKFPTEGNKIWFNRAFVYFHKSRDSGKFCREFNYIRLELGLIEKYVKKSAPQEE